VPLCPPETPQAARTRTRAAVGSQRLTAWATARPPENLKERYKKYRSGPINLVIKTVHL
jgi:hypothetical protein